MKVNLKRKVMLALLAGGMLCANSAFAVNWYGNGGNSIVDSAPSPEVLTGVNMTIDDSTTVGGNTVSDVNNIFGGRTAGAETVTGNSITFNTTNVTTINANIYAGRSGSGSATDNSVTIEDGFFVCYEIYGG
ncbi:MAG: hypothetical protein MJ048_04695 [Acidaminococcaceae bacterium]|nr:hypothetical protein [Acidaminococcaceae bacterium]